MLVVVAKKRIEAEPHAGFGDDPGGVAPVVESGSDDHGVMARRKVSAAAIAVTSAATARKTDVLVRGEVMSVKAAAKGPGLAGTPRP